MAATRKTQNDIGNYKPKLIGPFTARNCIFAGFGAVPAFFTGYIMSQTVGADMITTFIMCGIIMAPFLYLGFAHPHNMKPEDYWMEYYHYHMASPQKRLYKTETLIEQMDKEEAAKNPNQKLKNHPVHKPDPEFPEFL